MTVHIDPRRCEGNAVCVALAPDLFDLNEDDVAVVLRDDPDEAAVEGARRAASGCPREAIRVDP